MSASPLSTEIKFTVSPETAGLRLDKALSALPEIESRSQATMLISRGLVTLAGQPVKPAQKTRVGETYLVRIEATYSKDRPLEPYDLRLDILFEDADLLVVNKPAGLVVHPGAGHQNQTLVNALVAHTSQLANSTNAHRPGIVHRIDKDTSGLLVVAKTDSALRSLSRQFKEKTAHRIYLAVVYGPFHRNSGTVRSHLRRHPLHRMKFASEPKTEGTPKGKLAITHFNVERTHTSGLCLVKCRLETGRTHQIRVHLSETEHPIVADKIYCTPHRPKSLKSVALREEIALVPHLMLHAAELGFRHPRTGKDLLFKAPWPIELQPILKRLEFV